MISNDPLTASNVIYQYATKKPVVALLPACVKQNEQAFSAVNRSKTELCRSRLIYVACNYKHRFNFSLSFSCPLQKPLFDRGTYLGCYRDHANERDLNLAKTFFPGTNAPEVCISHCRNLGASLAGLQHGSECHCGNRPARPFERLPENRCAERCPGNRASTCGGFLSQKIFQTGVRGPIYHYSNLADPSHYPQDTRVRIAYLLVLNGRGWRQIKRLFRLIYDVNHYFYIHVDKRRTYLHKQVQSLSARYPNVRLTPWRMSTIWGGSSLLTMVLRSFQDLLEMSDWHWDYVINLSESDMPVKTNDYLTAFLTENKGRNFLKSHGYNTKSFIRKQGMNRLFVECDEHLFLIGDRELPEGVMLDGGSDWVALHRRFVRFAVQSEDALVRGLKDFFLFSLLPVESFFHTLAQNSEFCNSVIDNNLHFTNWDRRRGCKCQHKAVVDWCGCSPSVIQTEDFPRIQRQERREKLTPRPIFFARKFDPVIDLRIINKIEEDLYGWSTTGPSAQTYWESLSHPDLDTDANGLHHRALSAGLLGLASSAWAPLRDACPAVHLDWLSPGEAHALFQEAGLKAVLVRAYVGPQLWAELKFQRKAPSVRRAKGPGQSAAAVADRLLDLEVGSSYDPKEGIFRNYPGVMHPRSTVTVTHSWSPGSAMPVHFLWLDPSGRPVVLLRASIPAGDSPYYANFELELDHPPMRAGTWALRVLDESGEFAAEREFLVLPTLFTSNGLIRSATQAAELNCGPPGANYTNLELDAAFRRSFLDPDRRRASDRDCALAGEALGRHAADLLRQTGWRAADWCVPARLLPAFRRLCAAADPCEEEAWSSEAPDPKAELGPVRAETGRLSS